MLESVSYFRVGRFVEPPVAGEIVRAFVLPHCRPPIDVLAFWNA